MFVFSQFRNPSIQATNAMLYKVSDLMPEMQHISEDNLKKSFEQMGIADGSELLVSDASLVKPIKIRLQLG